MKHVKSALKNILFFIYIFPYFMNTGFCSKTDELELHDLVSFAMEHSPQIKIQMTDFEVASLNVKNATAAFLPSLDVSTSQGAAGKATPSESDWNSNLSLSLTETLYNNGDFLREVKKSRLRGKIEQLKLENEKAKLALLISQSYLDFIIFRLNFNITQNQFDLFEKQFDSVSNLYKQGLKTRIDYLRFKTRLERVRIDLKNEKVALENALEKIKALINWPNDTVLKLKVVDSEQKISKPIINVIETARSHRQTRIEQMVSDSQAIEVSAAKSVHSPVVTLESAYNYVDTNYLGGIEAYKQNDSTNWQALLKVSWNIWDWGVRRRNVEKSKLELLKSQHKVQNQYLELRQSIQTLTNNLDNLFDTLELNNELKKLEMKNFDTLSNDYRNGRAGFLDVSNALNDLASAQKNYIQNYFGLKKLIYEYYFHEGTIVEKIN